MRRSSPSAIGLGRTNPAFNALVTSIARGLANDNDWIADDVIGSTWLVRPGAIQAVEVRDPSSTGPRTQRVGFQVPDRP